MSLYITITVKDTFAGYYILLYSYLISMHSFREVRDREGINLVWTASLHPLPAETGKLIGLRNIGSDMSYFIVHVR